MSKRLKFISLSALLVLVVATGLWWLNRSRPSDAPSQPLATRPATPASQAAVPAATAETVAPVAAQPAAASVGTVYSPPATTASAALAASAPKSPASSLGEPPAPLPSVETATEIEATARMYAAHAPLRTPEVADPDSATNRQILSTMVAKALAQPPHLPAQSESSH